MSLQQSQGDN